MENIRQIAVRLWMVIVAVLVLNIITIPSKVLAQSDITRMSTVFYGGGIGIGFGDVEYFEISPMVGMYLNPRTSVGVSLLYRYRKDTRYNPSLSTNDYGVTLFGRYHLSPNFYAQTEYEYLSYEYFYTDLSKGRNDFGSVLAGGGFTSPIGSGAAMYVTVLYNISYANVNSPYDSPISVRFGIGVGF